ncbi:MAG TPA: ABC transporter ATP-binding protein [Rhodospirillaceae bacterium]|nr:ABC transporter ATP-binding protein [Magnetovibrio sp.]HBT43405.1 ABC transporter ATP-binding protein [Rhodospirillaceae bacterium]|tara:strand:- start:13821 stop:14525 length:705 start_codon:yes stop_codon:yes gene_type:complete
MTMLELNAVHAHYGKVHVLQGASLQVQSGEAVGLLGRNGVGKTTTLKTIMGLVKATGGEIMFDGRNLTDIAPHTIPGTGIGYVPQGRGIFPSLSVKENLEIGLTKTPPSQVFDYVFDRFPRLKERLSQPGGTLSGGEQQMLAIARCLVMQPRLLILDEPTEGIMPILVQDIRREIKAVNDAGMSILLVEQNIKTALRLCSRIYIMEKGAVVHQAAAQDLKDDKETLHRYLGVTV